MPGGVETVIVGGGPAGASAAIACSVHGARAIIVDRREVIGRPVQCAEGYTPLLGEMSIVDLPDRLTVWRTEGTIFRFDGEERKVDGRMWSTNMIDRAELDSCLYNSAMGLGARRITGEVSDFDDASLHLSDGREVPYGRLIIADGADSVFLDPQDKKRSVAYVRSYEVRGGEVPDPRRSTMFIGDYCEKGYGYIFPRGKRSANIGLGGLVDRDELERRFEEFCEEPEVKGILKRSEVVADKSGCAPLFGSRMRKELSGAIMVGDAANHNLKPFVEGFIISSICGYLAGAALSLRPAEDAKRFFDTLSRRYLGDLLEEGQRSFDKLCGAWDALSAGEIVRELIDTDLEGLIPAGRDRFAYWYASMMMRRRKRELRRTIRFPGTAGAPGIGAGECASLPGKSPERP
ncbi:NAD(P)/FAD-dependent oxidoreductase [Methanomassiliicoccus luminyensis]|uniref:NAD(P)/FAD-dependent oxidoreductase n=1 Tax=Methanomassiliicoccus luminyensis TaxID=1080712 RepID=UPI000360B700|nr:FAD-binding protein [Methanomassiliicoccus luminyensis]